MSSRVVWCIRKQRSIFGDDMFTTQRAKCYDCGRLALFRMCYGHTRDNPEERFRTLYRPMCGKCFEEQLMLWHTVLLMLPQEYWTKYAELFEGLAYKEC